MRDAERARELAPSVEEAGNVMISSYEALGRFEDAARLIGEQRCWGYRIDGGELLAAFRKDGATGYLRRRLELMYETSTGHAGHSPYLALAITHAVLGERDAALAQLEKLVAARAGGSVFIAVDPALRQFRGDDRFEALLKRVGTPMASAPHTTSR